MKNKLVRAAVSGVLFLLLIVLVKKVDVAAVGPAGTSIGLSHLNNAVHGLIGVHMLWYKITNLLGYVSLAAGAAFACLGVKQLAERRSLAKVDRQILALGALFVVIGVIYVLFEKAIVNYRPVIMAGETAPEASFPSSHTVLACVIFGSIAMMLKDYIKDKNLASALQNACLVLLLIAVLGRLISGVHWFTDILGGIFLSAALLLAFSGVLDKVRQGEK